MTSLPVDLTPKVARLVRLLGSPVDGEALAAARALDRTLRGAGCDLHALAAAIEEPPAPVVRVIYRDRPAPEADLSACYGRKTDQEGRRRDLARVQWLLLAPERLTFKEAEFLRSIRGRLAERCPLTLRQREWLDAIYGRVGLECA